jgi:hypothetical protein
MSLEQTIQVEMTNCVSAFNTSATPGLPAYYSKAFSLSDFLGATSLTSVFDQYRFDQIECWLEVSNPNAVAQYPQVSSAVDLDDATTPTAIGQVFDHIGAVTGVGVGGHYHRFRPHMALATYSGAFTSYANIPAGWVDCASPNVQHYGFKAAAVSQGAAINFQLTFRAVISFRAPSIN